MQRILKRLSLTTALKDSYRFLHVTIDTPWSIFVFLLLTIFAPFVLMAVLVWRYAERKVEKRDQRPTQPGSEE